MTLFLTIFLATKFIKDWVSVPFVKNSLPKFCIPPMRSSSSIRTKKSMQSNDQFDVSLIIYPQQKVFHWTLLNRKIIFDDKNSITSFGQPWIFLMNFLCIILWYVYNEVIGYYSYTRNMYYCSWINTFWSFCAVEF